MGIPAAVAIDHRDGEFNEAHASFDHAPGQDAFPRVSAGVFVGSVEAVQRPGCRRLVGDVHQLRDRHLHPGGQFIIVDRRFQRIDASRLFQRVFVEPTNQALFGLLQLGLFFRGYDVGQWSPLGMN